MLVKPGMNKKEREAWNKENALRTSPMGNKGRKHPGLRVAKPDEDQLAKQSLEGLEANKDTAERALAEAHEVATAAGEQFEAAEAALQSATKADKAAAKEAFSEASDAYDLAANAVMDAESALDAANKALEAYHVARAS